MDEPLRTPCPVCDGPLYRDPKDPLYAVCRNCGHDVMALTRAEWRLMGEPR